MYANSRELNFSFDIFVVLHMDSSPMLIFDSLFELKLFTEFLPIESLLIVDIAERSRFSWELLTTVVLSELLLSSLFEIAYLISGS